MGNLRLGQRECIVEEQVVRYYDVEERHYYVVILENKEEMEAKGIQKAYIGIVVYSKRVNDEEVYKIVNPLNIMHSGDGYRWVEECQHLPLVDLIYKVKTIHYDAHVYEFCNISIMWDFVNDKLKEYKYDLKDENKSEKR
jgi:hypothetical protein